jgi:hypothetical protein
MVARIGARRLVLAAAALALTVWILGFATRGLLSGDSGVKLAQAHALWDSGFSTRALPYDHTLDSRERFFPYGDFVRRVDGRRQGIYSLSFTALAAPLIGLFGLTGTMLLGLAGGILILVGVDLVGGRMGLSQPARVAAALVTVALTPVLLYSAQFAEHTPAVGLTMIALGLVCGEDRARPMIAGALVAFAATMRAECYLACATIGFALVARPGVPIRQRVREGAFYLAGAFAVLVPYWSLNLALSDTWDPMVTFQKAAPDRWANVKKMLIGEFKGPPPAFWLAILALATAAAFVPARVAWISRIVLGAALVWLAWTISRHATGRTLVGMFSITPIAAYGLLGTVWTPRWRPVWIFATVTTIAIVALNKSNDAGGLQLGARLVLPALPALIVLAAAAIDDDVRAARTDRRRLATLAAPAALLVLTAIMFHRALPPAYEIAAKSELAFRAVAAAPARVVVTHVWWESQVITPVLLDGKQIYLTGRDLRPVLEALHAAGVTEATIVHKQPIDIRLSDGARAHDRGPPTKAWLELHDVIID